MFLKLPGTIEKGDQISMTVHKYLVIKINMQDIV